ncbi:MAG: thioredoxin domain-containing protein, partial [Gammaproteobacteria bacterium]|nr:thioredoxin domain-containing protein [Gammaproteobacteria bacterium]
ETNEAKELLGKDWPLLSEHFGLNRPANFEGRHHLYQAKSIAELAKPADEPADQLRTRIDGARATLFQTRDKRVHPHRDEKILTAWNAMMIRGLAIAARHLDKPEYAVAASRAVEFLRKELWRDDRLLATWKDGRARFPAYLDDHAYLIDALLELLQCRWSRDDLAFAIDLAELLLSRFVDEDNGGFYFTADDHEELFHRSRPLSDDSTPSGNAIAARGLLRLGYLLGDTRYIEAAERTLRAAWDPMRQNPHAHTSLTNSLAEFLQPPEILVLRGAPEKLAQWQQRLTAEYQPQRLCYAIPNEADGLPEGLAIRAARGEIFAYLCRCHTCTAGMSLEELTRDVN